MKLSAHTDGASKGNPGPAAIGYTIEKDGVLLEEKYAYIGKTTNNVAEYKAFLASLKRMMELGATEVTVYSDSELVVRQINGIYKVKNPGLKPLYTEIKMLLTELDSCKVIHVNRENNSLADNLANRALKEHKSGK
ncbi:MAG: ribonuclease HI family protein [Candidatus Latescibacteria bacterium]|jgi:ribonuclease HI|nr:ribonuclease HI family protein [Candidatus Latescibacterota bacterium]